MDYICATTSLLPAGADPNGLEADQGRAMTALEIRPLSQVVGAEVSGMDFSTPADGENTERILEAFRQYDLLLFRNTSLTVEEQARFGRLFGKITVRGDYKPNEFPDTQHISNTRDDGMLGDGELKFHCDQLFYPDPLSALMLYAIEVPDSGGETLYCNTYLALKRLTPEMQEKLRGYTCRHAYDYKGNLADANFSRNAGANSPSYVHPMVWTNPATGREAIWIGQGSTHRVLELDPAESETALDQVKGLLYRQENIYTHRWKIGDLMIWNNRTLQHARTPFDSRQARTLRRTPIL